MALKISVTPLLPLPWHTRLPNPLQCEWKWEEEELAEEGVRDLKLGKDLTPDHCFEDRGDHMARNVGSLQN